MPYDDDLKGIEAARKAGYSDDAIAAHLSSRPEYGAAMKAGYKLSDIEDHLRKLTSSPSATPSPVPGNTSPASSGISATAEKPTEAESGPSRPDQFSDNPEAKEPTVYSPADRARFGAALYLPAPKNENPEGYDRFLKQADTDALAPSVSEPYALDNPNFNPDDPAQLRAEMGMPIVHDLPRPQGKGFGAGIARGLESAVEGLTSRTNIALLLGTGGLPAVAQKIGAAGFGTMMALEIPKKIMEGKKALERGDHGDAAEAWTGAAVDTLMAALSFGHAGGRLEGTPAVEKAKQTLRAQGLTQEQVDAAFKSIADNGPASLRNASDDTINAFVKNKALRKASGFPENVIEAEVSRRAAPDYQPKPSASTPIEAPTEPAPSVTPPVPESQEASLPKTGGRSALFQQARQEQAAAAVEPLEQAAVAAQPDAPEAAKAAIQASEAIKAQAAQIPPKAEVETPAPAPAPIAERREAPAEETPAPKESAPVETSKRILFRAADEPEARKGAHFSEKEKDAKAYQDNPGFGGKHLSRYAVNEERMIDVTSLKDLAEKITPLLSERQKEWADENGGLERAWRDAGFTHAFHVFENSFGPKSNRIDPAKLLSKNHEFARYDDDFPEGAKTWKYLGDKSLHPEESPKSQETPVAEQAPPATLTPAIRMSDGTTRTGENHRSIIELLGLDPAIRESPDAGFVDEKGNFLTREEAADRTGLPTSQEEGKLHSQDLPKKEGEGKPSPKRKLSELIEEELGEEEPAAPAPEPAISPTSVPGAGSESEPAAPTERTREEKLLALQDELKSAPSRDKARIRKSIKALQVETKPKAKEEVAEPETKNPTLDELLAKETARLASESASGPKELWQMSRKEAAETGKRGNAYMTAVRDAVKAGKSVPRDVLEQFNLFAWAREAMGKSQFPEHGVKALVEALKKMKKGSDESGAATLIPDLAEKVVKAGRLAYDKGMQAVDWASMMVKAFGERIRPYLAAAWKAIAGDSEAGSIGGVGGSGRKMGQDPNRQAFINEVGKPALREANKALKEAEDAEWADEDAANYAVNRLRDLMAESGRPMTTDQEAAARKFFSPAETKGGDSVEKGNQERREEGRQEGILNPPGEGEPVQPRSPEPDTTALKKAVVNEQRAARGEEEIETPSPLNEQELISTAKQRIDADPVLASRLVSRIVDEKDTRIDEEDAATILAERRRVINERNRWEDVAGDANSTEAQKTHARLNLGSIQTQLDRLDQASRAAGSTWGRVGRMYQVDLKADFTPEAMERKLRAAKGPLSEKEIQTIKDQAARIAKLEKEASEQQEAKRELDEAQEVIRTHEATIADLKKGKAAAPKTPTAKKALSESIATLAKSIRESALARIKARKGKMFADPIGVMSAIDLADHALVGATHILEGSVTFGKWSAKMIGEFGAFIKPHLKLIYDAAKEQAKKIEREASQPKEKTPVQAMARVKSEAVAGEELSHRSVYELARAHIAAGVHGEDAVMKAVHTDIKEAYPDATERDVRRAFSEYGKVKFPSKDAVDTELRELRRLTSLQESIDRETAGLDALHSGLQRDKATQSIREKQRQLNELLKKREGPPSPDKLASREEAKQTALKNAIADLDKQLRTGEKPGERTPTPDSPATEQLRAERDAMRDKLREIEAEANPPKTEAEKQVERLAKVKQRLDDLLAGRAEPKTPKQFSALSTAAENIQAEIHAMREMADQMKRDAKPDRDPGAHSEQMQIKALEKAIADYEKKTADRDFTAQGKKLGPDTVKVANLKEIRDSRRAMYEAVKNLGKVIKTPDEIYNERRMAQVKKQISELQTRIANKDFAPKPKPPEKNKTADVRKAEEELAKEKSKFRLGVLEAEKANRNAFQRFTGALANLNRVNVLGHVSVLEHLAGAAVENLFTRPVGTALAQVMRANKTLDAIRRKSVYEGHTGGEKAGLMATAKAWGAMVQKLKTGKSQLDWLHDAKQYPKEFGEIVGNVHAFIKEPIRQGIYARSMELRTKAAEAMGLDPAHDEVLAKALSMEAYNDANRDIFMGDNFLTKALHNSVGAYLRGVKEDSNLAHLVADVLDILFPVVNVSTNIAIRKFRLAGGLFEGAGRLLHHGLKGELSNNADKLTEKDAEKIVRALKYGATGLGLAIYAWRHANQFGGVYVPGQNAPRDKSTGLQTGEIALPGGHHMSHHITHGPWGGYMNLIADGKRLYDSKVSKGENPWSAAGEAGAFMALAGITDLPAFASIGRLTSPFKSAGQKTGEMIRNMLIFGGVQDAAAYFDKDSRGEPVKRSPQTAFDEFKMGVPVWRETVPEKTKGRRYSAFHP